MKKLKSTAKKAAHTVSHKRRKASTKASRIQERKRQKQAKRHFWLLDHELTLRCRANYIKHHYKKRTPIDGESIIEAPESFGIEKREDINAFLDTAKRIVNNDHRELVIDLSKCKRIWPSAITMLCSLSQWKIATSSEHDKSTIYHIPPTDIDANVYLQHCGFHDYVGVQTTSQPGATVYSPPHADIIKIRHETTKEEASAIKLDDMICKILKDNSALDAEGIEWFNNVVLTEIFANVTEHGMPIRDDAGWWTITQHHPTTGIISICIADNGIGIRKSLATGPQRHSIAQQIPDVSTNEGRYILKAMSTNISGAMSASKKARVSRIRMTEKYAKGQRRGHGLRRIKDVCRNLGIRLSILSNTGCLFLDEHGQTLLRDGFESKIFAGTMYHIAVPTKNTEKTI